MRLLLDTQAFLWWVFGDVRLSSTAQNLISDQENECLVSYASAWEIAIKSGLGKLKLSEPVAEFFPAELRNNGFQPLELKLAHLTAVESLPQHHRDPFDRLLITQALAEKLPVVSSDAAFDLYGVKRFWE